MEASTQLMAAARHASMAASSAGKVRTTSLTALGVAWAAAQPGLAPFAALEAVKLCMWAVTDARNEPSAPNFRNAAIQLTTLATCMEFVELDRASR